MRRRDFCEALGVLATAGPVLGCGALLARSPRRAQGRSRAHADVLNGIDVLRRQDFKALTGLTIGLITNQTGIDRHRTRTVDLLFDAPAVRLKALFTPEHGLHGREGEDWTSDSVDERTGVPIYNLHSAVSSKPTPEQLQGLDALVFDVQDIGCRFYTYIGTMGKAMEAAADARRRFVVLDRPNPINGVAVEGPIHRGESTDVSYHSTPLRHGMTVGELARMFNVERGIDVELTVIPVEGWRRNYWFDETGLPWTHTSPNMRTLTAAMLYPGVGLLESVVSVGRGTDTPFEIIGAPYVDDVRLAKELNDAGVRGVRFVPIRFTPRVSVFEGRSCGGVSMVVTERDALNAVDVGMTLTLALQRLYASELALHDLRWLLRHDVTIEAVRAGMSLDDIKERWNDDEDAFRARRKPFLLYPG